MHGIFRVKRFTTLLLAAGVVVLSDTGGSAAAEKPSGAPDAQALSRLIDEGIAQRLKAEKVTAAPLAGDAEFLRRVSLDLTGVVPTADRVVAFLDSKDPAKRAKLID